MVVMHAIMVSPELSNVPAFSAASSALRLLPRIGWLIVEIVVTGIGVVSPIGIGREAFWDSLRQGRSGIAPFPQAFGFLPARLGGQIAGFDPKRYVSNRKSLKIMSRDMVFGVAASQLAMDDAGIRTGSCDPDRLGVVFGADWICTPVDECAPTFASCVVDSAFEYNLWGTRGYGAIYPLRFLKTLPNMAACHVAIQLDARGPNNTHHQGEASSLMAIAEGVRVIERGAADVVIVGGASSLMDPYDMLHSTMVDELSPQDSADMRAPRPFDARRDGQVRGEGSAALVLERRDHAQRRGAPVLCRVLGCGAGYEGRHANGATGKGLQNAMRAALRDAGLVPGAIGHINAHGLGTRSDDRVESSAIGTLFSSVPVTAPKSFFGNLSAASGAVEAVASVLGLVHNEIPLTLNYEHPDPDCPVSVLREPLRNSKPTALLVNQTRLGQAAAVVLGAA